MTAAVLAAVVALGTAATEPCAAPQARNADGNYIVPASLGEIRYRGELALDAYVQQGAPGRPSVIVVHGGGWTSGSRVAHVGQLLELVTRGGYNWFSVDYRLGGLERAAESLDDLRAALAFIRCNAKHFGIDPSQLILLGEESGAHLAALLAAERPDGVIGAVLVGGHYDRVPGAARGPLPPLLVVHGGADGEWPAASAKTFCESVGGVTRGCEYFEVPGAGHRSENWWPSQWGYKKEILTWLAKVARAAPPSHVPRTGAVQKDIPFSHDKTLALDAYVPRSATPTPGVIIAHGGGWEAGDKVTYVTPLFEPLARAGLAWFSIDYRLTPAVSHPEQLDDLRQAIAFVRARHRQFNVDPQRIFLLGESASGQMVVQIATEDGDLAGVISFYGVYDLAAMVSDASPRSLLRRLFGRSSLDDDARRLLRKYSPLYTAHEKMPPILLVNGTGERLWPQAQAFARRLADLRVAHEIIVLDGAPHGLENWEGRADWTAYKGQLVDWIRRPGVRTQAAHPR
ncbi:MAG TPA: alpha/beta hydrolase [Vicinamibacterales bacterium]|nr:alpha/beta hydrolase [Vicinamibacterales bacterium]